MAMFEGEEKKKLESKVENGRAVESVDTDEERESATLKAADALMRIMNKKSAGVVFIAENDPDDNTRSQAVMAVNAMSKLNVLHLVVRSLDIDAQTLVGFALQYSTHQEDDD